MGGASLGQGLVESWFVSERMAIVLLVVVPPQCVKASGAMWLLRLTGEANVAFMEEKPLHGHHVGSGDKVESAISI